MALFTDGNPSKIEELTAHDSALLDVVRIEGIDLTLKLALATDEVGIELSRFLRSNHPDVGLDRVVVTQSLRKWHLFKTLSLVYRDAYNRQLNDRYHGKQKEYERLAGWAQSAVLELGVGVVFDPIPRAAAPETSVAAMPGAAGATYYVGVTWLIREAEGAASETAVLIVPDGSVPSVQAVIPPAGVTGWNVYAGETPNTLTLQNDCPLAPGEVWTAPATGIRRGAPLCVGQFPDWHVRPRRVLRRG